MATKFELLILSIHFFLIIFPVRSIVTSGDTNWWCNQTPNPKPCKYYMRQHPKNTSSMARAEFRKMAVHLALDQAIVAINHAKELGPKCQSEREKAAWADCVKLYDLTLLQLNQILDLNRKPTDFDIQTWLSAALTNLHTCETGFFELNFTSNILPLMSNNVSKLISNILAINSVSTKGTNDQRGFPSWFSESDLRLLQSPEPFSFFSPFKFGDLVVAQDGSGNFRTIGEALNASLKRNGNGRFVIYVKKGLYREYVEISYYMKNIMLVGEGLTDTIITGNRSNGAKFSTYDSATFSELSHLDFYQVFILGFGFASLLFFFHACSIPHCTHTHIHCM